MCGEGRDDEMGVLIGVLMKGSKGEAHAETQNTAATNARGISDRGSSKRDRRVRDGSLRHTTTLGRRFCIEVAGHTHCSASRALL